MSNAFTEVSSRQFFADELGKIVDTANITGKTLQDMMNADTGEDPYGMKAFIQTLIDAGIIDLLKYFFFASGGMFFIE